MKNKKFWCQTILVHAHLCLLFNSMDMEEWFLEIILTRRPLTKAHLSLLSKDKMNMEVCMKHKDLQENIFLA